VNDFDLLMPGKFALLLDSHFAKILVKTPPMFPQYDCSQVRATRALWLQPTVLDSRIALVARHDK
jgi:hypothetical protein